MERLLGNGEGVCLCVRVCTEEIKGNVEAGGCALLFVRRACLLVSEEEEVCVSLYQTEVETMVLPFCK